RDERQRRRRRAEIELVEVALDELAEVFRVARRGACVGPRASATRATVLAHDAGPALDDAGPALDDAGPALDDAGPELDDALPVSSSSRAASSASSAARSKRLISMSVEPTCPARCSRSRSSVAISRTRASARSSRAAPGRVALTMS